MDNDGPHDTVSIGGPKPASLKCEFSNDFSHPMSFTIPLGSSGCRRCWGDFWWDHGHSITIRTGSTGYAKRPLQPKGKATPLFFRPFSHQMVEHCPVCKCIALFNRIIQFFRDGLCVEGDVAPTLYRKSSTEAFFASPSLRRSPGIQAPPVTPARK